jgi:hypothetical protein
LIIVVIWKKAVMDQRGVAWMNFDGVSRSTVAIVVIVIIVLVILLVIRAIIIRRKADAATSVSPDSDDRRRHRRIKAHAEKHRSRGPEEGRPPFRPQVTVPTAIQPSINVAASHPNINSQQPNIGTVFNVPPVVHEQKAVHFQQGHVVEAKNVINTHPSSLSTVNQTNTPTCTGANCGEQLEATPQLVQAQQNIHHPNKEIPAYPQRQAGIRNARFAAQQQRVPVQQHQVQSQPRSNYRLQRGREVVENHNPHINVANQATEVDEE